MRSGAWSSFCGPYCRSRLAALLWLAVVLVTLFPAPLVPIAALYHALCIALPALAILGRILPPLPLALLLFLLGTVLVVGLVTGLRELIGTRCVVRGLDQLTAPLPRRVTTLAYGMGLDEHLTYLATPATAAFCSGLLRPRIIVTAGLVDRLDDAELTAVLLHERHHLRRHDPMRYLLLHALSAGLFMVPLASALQRWAETRMELAADQAALSVIPSGALAGALAAVLTVPAAMPVGMAALSATEARIAHLAGTPERTTVSVAATLTSAGLISGLGLALAWLGNPHEVWELICALCPGLT
jgi:Zn-dependent protease with chaperone function